jgi:hypothetical protein
LVLAILIASILMLLVLLVCLVMLDVDRKGAVGCGAVVALGFGLTLSGWAGDWVCMADRLCVAGATSVWCSASLLALLGVSQCVLLARLVVVHVLDRCGIVAVHVGLGVLRVLAGVVSGAGVGAVDTDHVGMCIGDLGDA